MAFVLFPGTLFSSAGHPAPPGPNPSQTKSQNLDPFADLSDLSSSLQGNEEPTLCGNNITLLCPGAPGACVCLHSECPLEDYRSW